MEDNDSYLKNDLLSTTELLQYTSSARPHKYFRALFKLYSQGLDTLSRHEINRLRNLFVYLGSIIKQLQLLSLVASVIPSSNTSSFQAAISKFLNLTRFDIQILNTLGQSDLTTMSLGLVYGLAFIFCLGYLQLFIKRTLCIKPLAILFRITVCLAMNFILLPLIIYSSVYLKYSWFSSNYQNNSYSLALNFDPGMAILFFFQLFLLFILSYFSVVFCYANSYSTNSAYSRSHSLVTVKELICIFAVGILLEVLSEVYFLFACIFIGGYMVYMSVAYLPYYSTADNTISIGIWASLAMCAILSVISRLLLSGFEVFFA